MWLDAKRENATVQSALNGQRPINVPQYILRGMLEYHFASVTGLRSGLRLSREGERHVTNKDDGNLILPAWTTVDASLTYRTTFSNQPATWRVGVSNLMDKRYADSASSSYAGTGSYAANTQNQYTPGAPRSMMLGLAYTYNGL